jgi:hypothetical protein
MLQLSRHHVVVQFRCDENETNDERNEGYCHPPVLPSTFPHPVESRVPLVLHNRTGCTTRRLYLLLITNFGIQVKGLKRNSGLGMRRRPRPAAVFVPTAAVSQRRHDVRLDCEPDAITRRRSKRKKQVASKSVAGKMLLHCFVALFCGNAFPLVSLATVRFRWSSVAVAAVHYLRRSVVID